MTELYKLTKENGDIVFHGKYCLYKYHKATAYFTIAFDAGAIRLIILDSSYDPENYGAQITYVTVLFEDGSISAWKTKWLSSYNYQFGVASSFDGKYIFIQTWENGLFCLDAHTGEKIWRTKSKRGITDIFVNGSTLLVHQRERALQLIDIRTGEILKEKRPATAWGFTAIDHRHIVCQVTARQWEIIDAESLETKIVFTHRDFTGGHENYCINHIKIDGQELVVRGFQNVWDNTVKPAKMLPNLEFEHRILVDLKI